MSKRKQGDQVLITFYAHGRDTTPGFLHRIATEDPMGYSLENISYFADEVKAKGGTLAVLDLSCYSGSTQDINDGPQVDNPKERGCIVTLASEKYVGMGICAGAKTESSFTSTIMKLPDPSIKISLEQHFLDSREKDTTPANLPQISSIPLPLKTFWDFFLSASDPNSIYRENGLSVNRVEASICRLCDKTTVMEYTKEIANLKNIAEKLGNAPLGKELTDKMQDYLKSYKSISQSINSVQRKMGMIPSWGFTEPVLKPFNKISLSRMRSLVNLTEPSVSLTDIKWLDENSREQITKLRPHHHKLAEALNKMGKALGKDWDIYENKKKILVQKAQEVMAAERKLYALHARSL
ncbi:MAG: hypothetical protein J0M15_16480 [Deltaproteobacteria bacterium]|nr:hypothetical protein [Deltaproteobacteria bacterium]